MLCMMLVRTTGERVEDLDDTATTPRLASERLTWKACEAFALGAGARMLLAASGPERGW